MMRFTTGIRVVTGSATIQDSWIGTDQSGAAPGPNIDGVRLQTSGSIVENCTISGNTGSGVLITGAGATNNIVRTSNIGTDWTGNGTAVPNLRGVLIDAGATANTIGGDATALNRIRNNGRCVVLDGVSGNTISFNVIGACTEEGIVTLVDGPNIYSRNSIAFNGQMGIDAGNDGPTVTGRPVLTTVRDTSTSYNVRGTVNGTANTQYTIEVFGNSECDGSTFGEGGGYFATDTVTTNASGVGTFLVVSPRNSTSFITATATMAGGGTSEFSACEVPTSCALTIPDNTLPTATTGVFFAQPVLTTGGIGTMSYALIGGTLPPGIVLGATDGVLAGTPQQPGLYNITVKATDGDGCSYSVGYQIDVQCGTLDVAPTMLPELMLGTPYHAPLEGSAGVPPYSFAITSGILPAGISLVGSTLMGTPTLLGTASSFIVTVTDANACTGTRLYMPTIGCPLSSLEPPTLPDGEVGELYRGFIQTFGGPEPYTYEVIGQLPPGVMFMPTGSVIGTPTEAGTYTFTIRSTDSGGCVTMQDYTIEITGGGGGGCCSAGTDGQQTIPIALLVIGLARRRRRR